MAAGVGGDRFTAFSEARVVRRGGVEGRSILRDTIYLSVIPGVGCIAKPETSQMRAGRSRRGEQSFMNTIDDASSRRTVAAGTRLEKTILE